MRNREDRLKQRKSETEEKSYLKEDTKTATKERNREKRGNGKKIEIPEKRRTGS